MKYKEYDDNADEAQTRRTEVVEEQMGDGGVQGSRARLVRKRKNISQKGFTKAQERWKFIADAFMAPPQCKKVEPGACRNKYTTLKSAYLAIRKVNRLIGGANYWDMAKEQRKEAVKRDKSLPSAFNQDVWNLCDEIIGAQEHVQYAGAADGEGMQERVSAKLQDLKRREGSADINDYMQRDVHNNGKYNFKLPRCQAEKGMM